MPHATEDTWLAFPSAANAKLWVGTGDPLRSALRLYHPYSRNGRVATACASMLPWPLSQAVLRGKPEERHAARLDQVARLIRTTLADDRLAISFSPGTPGPHQKMTAQASIRGRATAYVKIAENESTRALLTDEAAMLRQLHGEHLKSAVLPEVLGLEHHAELTLLFLSAPRGRTRARPVDPDTLDASFLAELAALGGEETALEDVIGAAGEAALDGSLAECDPAHQALAVEAAAAVSAILGGRPVRLGVSHGDYAPWNTLRLDDGALYVFDWEYGSRNAPLLTDALFRLAAPTRLVLGWSPARCLSRLLTLPDHPVFGPLARAVGISHECFPAYLLIFLLSAWVRELKKGGEAADFCRGLLRTCLDLLCKPRRRLKVLVAAYACEPGKGSEPGVGWNMAKQISRDHEAWVVTKDNNRAPIEGALAQEPNPNLHFVYVGLPRWLTFWKKGPRGVRAYYYLWQFAAWRASRRLGREVRFDLAHHVTFVNDATFSFLGLLPHPYVWGPIGSHPLCPPVLLTGWRSLLADRCRYGFRAALRSLDPLFWLSAARAKLIVGISKDTGDRFPLSWLASRKFLVSPAIGVEEMPLVAGRCRGNGRFCVLFVGRLVFLKGPQLAVRAFATFAAGHPKAELRIVGGGPMRAHLHRLAANLGVADRVHFSGWLDREAVLEEMAAADVFLFPSGEGGGMVVLEAMAHGLPVVCLDYGGPGEMVDAGCGFRANGTTQGGTEEELARALQRLAADKGLRVRMGASAQANAETHHLWCRRADVIQAIYSCLYISAPHEHEDAPQYTFRG
jgi:glycosyltransferase involved in cell wall biosynthesis